MTSKKHFLYSILCFSFSFFVYSGSPIPKAKGVNKSKTAPRSFKILTTVSDLAYITRVISPESKVESLCPGYKNPHFRQAKPSGMKKINGADAVFSVGLELEIGWLPKLIDGGRNPSIAEGKKGYLEIGKDKSIKPIEIPHGKVTRDKGDIHPGGNPHFTLDPIRCGQVAQIIAKRLGILDPDHSDIYKQRADKFEQELKENKNLGEAS